MTLDEATNFVKQAWPGEGVHLRRDRQVCEVVARNGEVLGRAFNWRSALREAYNRSSNRTEGAGRPVRGRDQDRELFVEFPGNTSAKFENERRKKPPLNTPAGKADPLWAYPTRPPPTMNPKAPPFRGKEVAQ